MPETQTQLFADFLAETEPLIEKIDELPVETVCELYDMYEEAARAITAGIPELNPEIRVQLCDRLDSILERITDMNPAADQMSEKINIFTPAIQGYRTWSNVELLKDKGLAGYMLAREINARPIMYFGTKCEDYPYLSALPDMEILYRNTSCGAIDGYYEHLYEHYPKMDVLILHGMYNQTISYLDAYRKLRPDGKVYCGLDMNSYWMGKIDWNSSSARKFAEQCDIVATSCRSLRDALNRNPDVHFPCRWFPNGFFNPGKMQIIADPEKKENILLTVGRIGTAQKNNAEMLIAFARVSDELPDWSLRLVGIIAPEFQSFIDQYFAQRPDLKDRVVFTGAIENKDQLYCEYERAKVFILTSQLEGGTPNVIAEALFHGCMFITSDIDAADDITDFGALGAKYKLGDIDALTSLIVKICATADKNAFKNHIPKALAYAAKYYDWERNAKKLAYMIYNAQARTQHITDSTQKRKVSIADDKMDMSRLQEHLLNFDMLCQFIQRRTPEMIVKNVSDALFVSPAVIVNYPMGGYSRVMSNDGSFSKGSGAYMFILQDMKQHLDDYKYVYSRLSDDISREVFLLQMSFRVLPVMEYIKSAYSLSAEYAQYFAEDIFRFGKDEVFVDCGGYIGDTAEQFVKRCRDYKRIYIYEPLEENIEKCRENLADIENIVIRQAGVGKESSEMVLRGGGSSGSFAATTNPNAGDGDVLKIVSLDEDIKERVTFIKMDVECFEPEAILGAAGHIKNDSPKLAICLYHMISDLWEIPILITGINHDYKYYLRHYDANQNWEYVLYAIP